MMERICSLVPCLEGFGGSELMRFLLSGVDSHCGLLVHIISSLVAGYHPFGGLKTGAFVVTSYRTLRCRNPDYHMVTQRTCFILGMLNTPS